ncbi:MAG: hypothetical protein IPP64_09575 [Bacteroidetes bacterium]|nr:hypothetical protein [Bacteroidota bacterium]
MKLEHRKQKVVSLSRFIARLLRYSVFAAGLIVISVSIGVFGYHYLANLSWLDSFHMACLILTGMGPIAEMQTSGAKMFDSFYALYSGVAFLSITAVFFAPIVHRIMHILHVDDER